MGKRGPKTKFSKWKKEGRFVETETGRHLCTSIRPACTGYYKTDYKGRSTHLHRRLWQEAYGDLERNQIVMHKCDNKSCINLDHLEVGTTKQNVKDAIDRGLCWWVNGEDCHSSKLSEDDVRFIRSSTENSYALSKILPVSYSAVKAVRKRRTWKHLP